MSTRVPRFISLWVGSICAVAALAAGLGASRALATPPPGVTGVAAPQGPPGSDWQASAARHIAEREYRASANGEGLQAPNRRHNLRTWFEPTGVRVHDRTAPGAPELLRLQLVGVGRGERLAAVPPGQVSGDGARVEIRRPGLVEWYLNSPAGLEQGFTLEQRPAGDGPLVLELALPGSRARLVGSELRIATRTGRRLAYGGLAASDVDGNALAARLEAPAEGRIALVVDDRGARYPLTVDPLLTATADTQLESDQASAFFGGSVAGAGDVNGDGYDDVIVGAEEFDSGQLNEGAVFVFLGSSSGIADGSPATAHAQLEANQSSALLGSSIAGAGDVNGDGYADVIVGAQDYDAGTSNEGAAFVFLGSATGIADGNPTTAHAQLESDQADALFGGSVAGAGDVNGDGYADVIVGSEWFNAPTSNEGAAFVFLGSATGIPDGSATTAHAQLEANQSAAGLGGSVAGAGDVNGDGYADVIVSAETYTAGAPSLEGAAFVFLGSATGIADGNPTTAHAQLESDQADALFGGSVAGAGDVNGDGYADVIVGAEGFNAPTSNEGAAFVFLGSATGIADGSPATAHAQLESDLGSALFGSTVAGAGDVNGDGYADLVVGSVWYDAPTFNEGAAFVFLGSASGIADGTPATADAQLESDQSGATLGNVAAAGDVNGDGYADVIAGADSFDADQTDEGVAFVFLGGAAGIADGSPTTAAAQLDSDQVGAGTAAGLGASAAAAGDVNGDGYADVIVGASGYDAGETDEGAAFVFLGNASGIADGDPSSAAAQLESDQAGAALGRSVASAGDVNGDGYADVIAGAPLYDAGETDEGAAFVFLGSASGIADGDPSNAAAQLESDQADAQLGAGGSVASAGDVNGDGYADVVVGAPLFDAGQTDEGAAFAFLGSASGIASGSPATAATQLESNQASASLGRVASAGDVNGDGYADLIAGAGAYDDGQTDEGAAFVFLGSASGIPDGSPATAAAQLESDQAGATLGASVASAGDVNGDGYADAIVGSSLYDAGQTDEGAAFVFLGSASGIPDGSPATAAAQLESDQAGATLGAEVASAGDVNGDGYADAIVGSSLYDAGQTDEGAAFVFLGSASGIPDGSPATAAAQLESDQADARLGASVASAGDVNGDGYADVIAGATRYDDGETDEGSAFVFLGGGAGRPVRAHAERGDASGIPVQAWGAASSTSAFAVELVASHPAGSGRVRAEVEACPPGVPFGDAGCTSALGPSWVAVGGATPEATLGLTLSGLSSDTLYRWRARVLHAPATGSLPTLPSGGPWRRPGAQSVEADLRTLVPAPPDDGDGVAAAVEDAAPNSGDGNGDGTADSLQSAVASLPDIGASYVTVEVSGGCTALESVSVVAEASQPASDPVHAYPYGVAGFELPCSSATVELFFHATASLSAPYRKYGPTTPGSPGTAAWYTLGGAVFGSQLVGANTVATVTLSLSDGSLGDATGVDGAILDPGGPALVVDADADGALDAVDNCTQLANPSQLDVDADGCGNACDADYDQNGVTGASDFNVLRACFAEVVPGSGPAADPLCAESDMDGNGVVGSGDFNTLRTRFAIAPGPGATCPW